MILSAQQLFSDDQAIVATAISENVIDLGLPQTPYGAAAALNDDVGKGAPIPVLIQVTEDFNTLTSLTVTLETDSTANLATAPIVLATESILLADLVAGKQTFMQFVPNGATKQYMGVRYTVVGTNPTLGNITAGITMGNQTNVTGA
jgi:hypothetical protein